MQQIRKVCLIATMSMIAGMTWGQFHVAGSRILPGEFNIITYSASHDARLGDLVDLHDAMTPAVLFQDGDELRIYMSRDKMEESPMARIWVNSAQGKSFWFHTGGKGSAADFVIKKGYAVVLYTKHATEGVIWENPLVE